MGFTQIPNWLLDTPNDLTSAEFRVLMCIYRLTVGYQRNKYKISYSQLTEMSGIKKISPIIISLRKKKMISYNFKNGKKSEIIIIKPNHSGHRTKPLRSSHLSNQVIGLRGTIENSKENNKEKDFVFRNDESKEHWDYIFKYYPKEKINDKYECIKYFNSLEIEEQILIKRCVKMATEHWTYSNFDTQYIPQLINYMKYKYKESEAIESIRKLDYERRK